jgi:hypothetical protein
LWIFGVEEPEIYDEGVLFWRCATCSFAWPEWFPPSWVGLRQKAQEAADHENLGREDPRR